jgi:hypothetical protein
VTHKRRYDMAVFTMAFIHDQGVDRSVEGWDDGLADYGHHRIEDMEEVPLAAANLEDAMAEAHQHWLQWFEESPRDGVDGYVVIQNGNYAYGYSLKDELMEAEAIAEGRA